MYTEESKFINKDICGVNVISPKWGINFFAKGFGFAI